MIELDRTDRLLLDLLQGDARQSLETLAARVDLSAAAVQRRIKRLRDGKVITGEVVQIDAAAVGLPMTFIVTVELERERADEIDAFRRKASKEPQVQQAYYITGEGDFILIVLAPRPRLSSGRPQYAIFGAKAWIATPLRGSR